MECVRLAGPYEAKPPQVRPVTPVPTPFVLALVPACPCTRASTCEPASARRAFHSSPPSRSLTRQALARADCPLARPSPPAPARPLARPAHPPARPPVLTSAIVNAQQNVCAQPGHSSTCQISHPRFPSNLSHAQREWETSKDVFSIFDG